MKTLEEGRARYELVFVARTEEAMNEVNQTVLKYGATNVVSRAPLRMRLSFPINKVDSGFWGVLQFTMNKEMLALLRASLVLQASLLRSEIIRVLKDDESERRDDARDPRIDRETREAPREISEETARVRARESHPRHAELSNEALEKKLEEMLR